MTETRQYLAEQLRGVDRDGRTVDIVASDFSLDSYGTRIDPAGWNVDQFKKNPVICMQHDSHGWTASSGLPIANAMPETVRVENGRLLMRVRFPAEGTSEVADQVFALVADGFLRGVSVGFDPESWQDVDEEENGTTRRVRIYRKQRLMEVSFVTIPSNDNALVQRATKLNHSVEDVKERTAKLEESLRDSDKEFRAAEEISKLKPSHLLKCSQYMESKQRVNKAASRAMEKFFKARKIEQPSDELDAFNRMQEIIDEEAKPVDAIEVKVDATEAIEQIEKKIEELKEEPTPPPTPAPEAPEPERKASVQVPIDALVELPAKLARSYVGVAVEALRRGIPPEKAVGMIDGLNESVTASLTNH